MMAWWWIPRKPIIHFVTDFAQLTSPRPMRIALIQRTGRDSAFTANELIRPMGKILQLSEIHFVTVELRAFGTSQRVWLIIGNRGETLFMKYLVNLAIWKVIMFPHSQRYARVFARGCLRSCSGTWNPEIFCQLHMVTHHYTTSMHFLLSRFIVFSSRAPYKTELSQIQKIKVPDHLSIS